MIDWAAPYTDQETAVALQCRPFTMTSGKFLILTQRLLQDLDQKHIEGDVVECGVWRGGHIMAAGLADRSQRHYWLFDTFEGMASVSEHDYRDGKHATDSMKWRKGGHEGRNWCRAELDDVQSNVFTVLPEHCVTFVKGDVCETLSSDALPERIAFLRLDTDFYLSTRAELETLYPRLVPGGYLVVDDYRSWDGARKAVDEYFADQPGFALSECLYWRKP